MEKSIWNLTFNFTSSYPTNPSSLQLVLRLGTFFGSHGLHTTPQCWKGSKKAIIFFGNVGTKPISNHKSQLYHILLRLTGKKSIQFPSQHFCGFLFLPGQPGPCVWMHAPPAITCGYPRRTSISFCLNSSVQLPPSGQGASSAGALQSIWWSSGPQENSRQIGPRLGNWGDSGGNRTKDF